MYNLLDKVIVEGNPLICTVIGISAENPNRVTVTDGNIVIGVISPVLFRPNRPQTVASELAMYVLVRNTAPIGLGINAIGHVTHQAAHYFKDKNYDNYEQWMDHSNKQRSCIVTDDEYYEAIEAAHEIGLDYTEFVEPDWRYGDNKIAVAFEPAVIFPNIFKTIKLHSGMHL